MDKPWKLMVVDDEKLVHSMTAMVLDGFEFQGRPLQMLSAYSAAQARTVLQQHPDTAVILLDVMMETDDAGLQFVRYVRDQLRNAQVRIILRTGQPGQAPESRVVHDYDINDYREKSDLTAQKLVTSVTTALRAYSDLQQWVKVSQQAIEAVQRHPSDDFDSVKHAFLSRMSHELLTPMNAIMGFSQLLSLNPEQPLSASQQRNVEEILQSSERLLSLIGGLLELSELEAGKIELRLQPVSLTDLVKECVELVAALADARRIKLLNLCGQGGEYPQAEAEPTRLRQVLLNLLLNAIKHNHDEGLVILSLEPRDSVLRLSVVDTGAGLSPQQQERLFQPFGLLDISTTGTGGLGIGLSLSKLLIERMGGRLDCKSEPGKGSVFWLELQCGKPSA